MFGNKHSKPQNRIDSLIGTGTKVNGDLHFSGGLRVDGEIEGKPFERGPILRTRHNLRSMIVSTNLE